MTKRIGFLGGTFDPIHKGHLAIAQYVKDELNLDELQLIPNHVPPHKEGANVSSKQRLEMAQLAANSVEGLTVNPLELERDQPSYSIDTLQQLRAEHPGEQLFFIMGMDSFANLSSWYKWDELLHHVNLVVCQRPSDQLPEQGKEAALLQAHQTTTHTEALAGQIICLQNPDYPVSSTQIRLALLKNRDVHQWLLPEILEFIQQNRLYQSKHTFA